MMPRLDKPQLQNLGSLPPANHAAGVTPRDERPPAELFSDDDQLPLRVLRAELRELRLISREDSSTVERLMVLVHLSSAPAHTQTSIEQALAMQTKVVREMLDALIGAGLARRDQDPHDGRRHAISLTAAGAELALTIAKRVADVRRAELLEAKGKPGLGEIEQRPPVATMPEVLYIEDLLAPGQLAALTAGAAG
jgi:DNA-binding MarR family transcriptional regulator